MRAPTFTAVAITIAALAAGCAGSKHASSTSRPATTGAFTNADAQAALTPAARDALRANHRVAIQVLWRNIIPAEAARSTRGPALASLRNAAAARRRRGIRVRLLSDKYRILSLRLDPSYERATAVALGVERVQPYGRDGHPIGHAVSLNEKARVELRRLDGAKRFVVWKVTLIR
jgi:hypothetical protein